jgi:hypothetical protein
MKPRFFSFDQEKCPFEVQKQKKNDEHSPKNYIFAPKNNHHLIHENV